MIALTKSNLHWAAFFGSITFALKHVWPKTYFNCNPSPKA